MGSPIIMIIYVRCAKGDSCECRVFFISKGKEEDQEYFVLHGRGTRDSYISWLSSKMCFKTCYCREWRFYLARLYLLIYPKPKLFLFQKYDKTLSKTENRTPLSVLSVFQRWFFYHRICTKCTSLLYHALKSYKDTEIARD